MKQDQPGDAGVLGADGTGDPLVAVGRRIRELAAEHPDKLAMVVVGIDDADREEVTWANLEARSNQVARALQAAGARPSTTIMIAMRNSAEYFYAAFGAWKLGACVLPVSPSLAKAERDALIGLAEPSAYVAETDVDGDPHVVTRDTIASSTGLLDTPLPDLISRPGKAIASGGSTGSPKLIVDPRPLGFGGNMTAPHLGMYAGQVQLVAAGLFHNAPLGWATRGLMSDHTLVVMRKFDAAQAVRLIASEHVQFLPVPPIIMQRILRVPGIEKPMFASIQGLMHTGAPCPPWVKRGWIDLIGAPNVHEGFGASEDVGATNIHGDEWLEHPGSVGRPIASGSMACEMRILGEDGTQVPVGTVGEIFMRPLEPGERFRYVGSPPPKTTKDGFVSVGDMGWVDDDGWLFLADRRVDMIISGGINVYPAEIEARLTEHPGIADVAVIGVPDEDWGLRVHAVVQPADADEPPSTDELNAFARQTLAGYKAPKSYEFLTSFPRDEAGKIRRSRLVTDRSKAWTPGMIAVA